jgi:hypothetical protein
MAFSTRRTFLQTGIAAIASFFLPRVLLARGNPRSFWFLHTPTGQSWVVDDPVSWSLENATQPILERARERLVTLDAADPQRVIRLVVRRCKLNLLGLRPERVVVHHWGPQGKGDLRPFFKKHGLARNAVRVTLIDRKREITTLQPGDDFLYGERLPKEFPLDLYSQKWQRRGQEEPDDWTAAPASWSSFVWEGIEPGLVPLAVLMVAWRKENPPLCLNCDTPLVLFRFGRVQCGMLNLRHSFHRMCLECRRLFEDSSPPDLAKWLVAHLDKPLLPGFQQVWGKVVKWQPPSDHMLSGGDTKTP